MVIIFKFIPKILETNFKFIEIKPKQTKLTSILKYLNTKIA
jgi:hypothetical protein